MTESADRNDYSPLAKEAQQRLSRVAAQLVGKGVTVDECIGIFADIALKILAEQYGSRELIVNYLRKLADDIENDPSSVQTIN